MQLVVSAGTVYMIQGIPHKGEQPHVSFEVIRLMHSSL